MYMYIVFQAEREDGTQLKVMLTFANGGRALFKPLRYVTTPNHTQHNHDVTRLLTLCTAR